MPRRIMIIALQVYGGLTYQLANAGTVNLNVTAVVIRCPKEVQQKNRMDPEELLTFQKVADGWWSKEVLGVVALKSMNELRIPYIVEGLKTTGIINGQPTGIDRPLSGISILDVGCGGGFASEPLAELGAEVTGIDGVPELIEVAKKHVLEEGKTELNLTYYAETLPINMRWSKP